MHRAAVQKDRDEHAQRNQDPQQADAEIAPAQAALDPDPQERDEQCREGIDRQVVPQFTPIGRLGEEDAARLVAPDAPLLSSSRTCKRTSSIETAPRTTAETSEVRSIDSPGHDHFLRQTRIYGSRQYFCLSASPEYGVNFQETSRSVGGFGGRYVRT